MVGDDPAGSTSRQHSVQSCPKNGRIVARDIVAGVCLDERLCQGGPHELRRALETMRSGTLNVGLDVVQQVMQSAGRNDRLA
jgi:hypothetical protein